MAAKTTQDWIYRALTEMGRLHVGEAPPADDYNTVNDLVGPLSAQLTADKIVYIGDVDAIEPELFLPLARLLSIEAAPSFGNGAIQTLLTRNRVDNLDALREREYVTLRRLTSAPPTSQPLRVEYF